jgi:hypothetical protein
LEADVDMISFDAYQNSGSLNIIAKQINNFLAKGGYINWGIVPVSSEKTIKGLNCNMVYDRFIKAAEELGSAGVSLDLIYRNCTVSTIGGLAEISILFAEKALILLNQLAKKIPSSSANQL